MSVLACSLAAVLLSCPPPLTQDAEPAQIVRNYDVRALVSHASIPNDVADPRLPLDAAFLHSLEVDPGMLEWPTIGSMPHEDWGRVLLRLLPREQHEEVEVLEENHELLTVSATERGHERVGNLLRDIEALLLQDVLIEAHTLKPEVLDRARGAYLSADEVDALLASSDLLESRMLRTRMGRAASLRMVSGQAFLSDYNVEVAQYQAGAEPLVSVLFEGLLGGVHVEPAAGGELTVRSWMRYAKLHRPLESIEIAWKGARLHQPVVDTLLAVASADCPAGGGLLLGSAGAPVCVLVRARRAGPPPDVFQGSTIIDLHAELDIPFLVFPYKPGGPSPSGGFSPPDWDPESLRTGPNWQVSSGRSALDGVFSEVGLDPRFLLVGKYLIIAGDPEEQERARAAVMEMRLPRARTYEIEARFGDVDARFASRLGELDGDFDWVDDLDGRVLGTARAGDSLLLVGGEQRLYLREYDLEVAAGVAIGDPIIESLFDGAYFWARVLPLSDGSVSFTHSTLLQDIEEGVPAIESDAEDTHVRGMTFPRAQRMESWSEHAMPLNRWTLIKTGPAAPGKTRVLVVRVREAQL